MNKDITLFSSFTLKKGDFILYGDDNKGRNIGFVTDGNYINPMIEDALLF